MKCSSFLICLVVAFADARGLGNIRKPGSQSKEAPESYIMTPEEAKLARSKTRFRRSHSWIEGNCPGCYDQAIKWTSVQLSADDDVRIGLNKTKTRQKFMDLKDLFEKTGEVDLDGIMADARRRRATKRSEDGTAYTEKEEEDDLATEEAVQIYKTASEAGEGWIGEVEDVVRELRPEAGRQLAQILDMASEEMVAMAAADAQEADEMLLAGFDDELGGGGGGGYYHYCDDHLLDRRLAVGETIASSVISAVVFNAIDHTVTFLKEIDWERTRIGFNLIQAKRIFRNACSKIVFKWPEGTGNQFMDPKLRQDLWGTDDPDDLLES